MTSEQRGPGRILAGAADAAFPGPFAAFLLTLAALFATSLMFNAMLEGLDFIAAVGIGQVIGLGGVAALAARRVPPPHTERIGLRAFSPALLPSLLALLPVVIVVSEIDNWVRPIFPPSETVAELQKQFAEQTRIDSPYAMAQTLIVAVGISPVVEGFFFFGVVLQGLVARLGRALGAFVTALLYSLVHFPASGAPGDAIVPIAFALIAGSLLALARLGTGSVLASMGLAAGFAAVHLAAAATAERFPIPGFNGPGEHTPPAIVVPCVVSVLAGTYVLWRRSARGVPASA